MYVIILNLQNLLFTLLYIRVRAHRGEMRKVKAVNCRRDILLCYLRPITARVSDVALRFMITLPTLAFRDPQGATSAGATCDLSLLVLAMFNVPGTLNIHCDVSESVAFQYIVECALSLFQEFEILHGFLQCGRVACGCRVF